MRSSPPPPNPRLLRARCTAAPSCRRPQVRVLDFNGREVRVQELAYSESGTAHNVWTAAMVMAQWMTQSDTFAACISRGDTILELGSGLGVAGILAAKLGGRVTLSDFVGSVLQNLERNIKDNGVESCATVVRLNWADDAGLSLPPSLPPSPSLSLSLMFVQVRVCLGVYVCMCNYTYRQTHTYACDV